MTPEQIKFFLSLAGAFLAVAGVCFAALSLSEIIRGRKLDIADLSTKQKDIIVLTRRAK